MSIMSSLFTTPRVVVHTDGSCDDTLTGGWCAIINTGLGSFSITGGDVKTTNNRMELLAVVSALEQIRCDADVVIYTDSQYVAAGCLYVKFWKQNNWVSRSNTPVKNKDLWERYLECAKYHRIRAVWQKGHDGELYNELCDKMAKRARDHLKTLTNRTSFVTTACSCDDIRVGSIPNQRLIDDFVKRNLECIEEDVKEELAA